MYKIMLHRSLHNNGRYKYNISDNHVAYFGPLVARLFLKDFDLVGFAVELFVLLVFLGLPMLLEDFLADEVLLAGPALKLAFCFRWLF